MHNTKSIVPNFLIVVPELLFNRYCFLFVADIQQLFVYSQLGHKTENIKAPSLAHRRSYIWSFDYWP